MGEATPPVLHAGAATLAATYALSPMQQGMLFESLAGDPELYLVQLTYRVHGQLVSASWWRAWREIAGRHDVLRTSFAWGEPPLQHVHRGVDLVCVEEDWRASEGGAERLEAFLEADRRRGFDLNRPPLMRLALLRLDEDVHEFVWSFHHILLEGWSAAIVLDEVLASYEAIERGAPAALEALRPYRDFVAWLEARDLRADEAHWRAALADVRVPTPLPSAHGEHTRRGVSADYAEAEVLLSRALTGALRAVARTQRVTLNTLIQAAWAILLARYSGESTVVFGATVSGRSAPLAGIETIVGLCINVVPVSVPVSPDQSVLSLLTGLQARQGRLGEHEHTPLAQLKRWAGVPPDHPLFETLVVFESWTGRGVRSGGARTLELQATRCFQGGPGYPVALVVDPETELALTLIHDRRRFWPDAVTRLLGHYVRLLEGIVADPSRRIGALPMLTEPEERQHAAWNATEVDFPRDVGVHQLVEAAARDCPEAVAVVGDGPPVTYRDLNRRANRLAHHLRALGVGPDVRVGVCLPRSPEMVVALLGILKAGGAYVPLDPAYPRDRLAFMLADAEVSVVVTGGPEAAAVPAGPTLVRVGRATGDLLTPNGDANPISGATGEHLAYVMYTSGSTGMPKGVAVPHRAITRLVVNTDYAVLDRSDVVAQVSAVGFDAATFEIWGALVHGARLTIVPRDILLSPSAFAARLQADGATTLFLTTALFNRLAGEIPAALAPLRHLLFGGEASDPGIVRTVLAASRPRRLVHVYGPTETTTFAAWHLVEQVDATARTVPIGRPIRNTEAHVLDTHGQIAPVGVPGELYIGGPGLARGYLNRPELTARCFVRNPLSPDTEARLYRTGDLVRRLPDGALEFLGRLDDQVKIRGFRVEPGEVEATLRQHPEVTQAVVVAREDVSGDRWLAAYVVLAGPSPPAPHALRAFLGTKLPEYLVPSSFTVLERLPLTPNGKVDRQALPASPVVANDIGRTFVAPRNPLEAQLSAIWRRVLGRDGISVTASFGDLGLHSLLALELVSQVQKQLGLSLSLVALFEHPTIERLVDVIRGEAAVTRWKALVPLQPLGGQVPFFCVPGAGSDATKLAALARRFPSNQPFYALQYAGTDGIEPPHRRVKDMVALYLTEIEQLQPEGPYLLGGSSFGGVVAYEMARELVRRGRNVALLALLDTYAPGYPRPRGDLRGLQRLLVRVGMDLPELVHAGQRGQSPLRGLWTDIRNRAYHVRTRVLKRYYGRRGAPLPVKHRYFDLLVAAQDALDHFEPSPYPGHATLFRAAVQPRADLFERDPTLGWGALVADGITIIDITGYHSAHLQEPYVDELATKLQAAIVETRTAARPRGR